ncbi:MAG: DUF4831 family protein [Rikenellaceae bacterium]|jgi:hypothetical protein|nr:DUF4831 family protein [Rikenellaceae bacterium]
MKKLFVLALTALFAVGMNDCYSQDTERPRTTISITVSAETQTIRTGPYARFAQKYLGVMAPLSDKQLSTVTGASISYMQLKDEAPAGNGSAPVAEQATGLEPISHTRNALEFVKVPIDRKDLTERSPEEAAREAANTIFALRKHRIELVTGMAGENVFGAGLPAALAELDRLEEEYLSLFMGKRSRNTVTKVYTVTPEQGEANRIVCRFSDAGGLLPSDDLSGSPIMLEMKALASPQPAVPAAKPAKNAPPTIKQYFPGMVACRLQEGKNELAQARIPVYQMGSVVEIPVSGGR